MKNEGQTVEIRVNKLLFNLFLLFGVMFITPAIASTDVLSNTQQQISNAKVTLNVKDKTLINVLSQIKKQTGLAYGFKNNQTASDKKLYSIVVSDVNVESALTVLLKDSPYSYEIVDGLILITEKKKENVSKVELINVKGKIVDEKGNPIPGASIIIYGTIKGVASDANGRYSIDAKPDDVLKVSFVGYKNEVVPIKGNTSLNVRLNPTVESMEEVTVVAFGEQKKESVVSAITTVRPMDLKSSSSDLTTSFAGKIAGIVGWQTGGLPGALTEEEMNTKFYIRGITSFQTGANIDPLILIDGVESSKLELARIAPEDIESFSVMKDASATAMYGARGANGVILVETKKGQEGSVYTSVRYEAVASMPTQEIDVVDPITYMKMYNQALTTRDPYATPQYSVERIDRTGSPDYPSFVYPMNDWYKLMFKSRSINHRMGINIRGGSKIVQYYASVNYNRDEGMLKTDRLNDFNCNIINNSFSYRTNLNIDLTSGIKLVINSTANFDKYNGPFKDVQQAYGMAFKASPVDFAPMYPPDLNYNWPHLLFGRTTNDQQINPYMEIHRGYTDRRRFSSQNKVEYIQNLSSLIKGLELRGSVAMQQTAYAKTGYFTKPHTYVLQDYDFETGKHTLNALNEQEAQTKLAIDPNSSGGNTSTRFSYQAQLLHTAAWKNHQTSLTAVFNAMEYTSSPAPSVLNGMPNRNLGLSMRGTYGFKDRYFLEASFGYNGSERFAQKNKMGFFPAVGAAWVITKMNSMESINHIVSFLKARASYGRVGNDGIIKEPRFVYLPLIDKGDAMDPTPMSQIFNRYVVSSYGNEDIKWEIAEQINLGLETKLFKGLMEFNLDVYQEIRHNIIAYRTTIPGSVGIEKPPLDNIGKARSRGFDFSGKLQHSFSKDFWVILNGTLTYNKTTYLEIEEPMARPEWQKKTGHELSQGVGYIAEGLFRDKAEIATAPRQGGDLMPGDIRYRDINNDGIIDINDAVHIGFPETPRITYGFSGFITYKSFELSFSFQGSGKRSFFMNPAAISPFAGDNALLKAIHDDHWTEENMAKRPFWPRLSTENIKDYIPQENWANGDSEIYKSTYFMRECRFLRCTGLELGYTLPNRVAQKMKLQNTKFFVRANNPFILTNFKVWDVELGSSGFNYPIQKTYALGVNISF
ncbi:MAG: SusC/RagA family TonB-linked outer membrane protein [Marinifilaceae bacterium]